MIMTTVALLRKTPKPTDADIDTALGGHICRCGTYSRIRKAVHLAAATMPAPAPVAPAKGAPKSAPKKGATPPKGVPAPKKGGAA
jgi:isoquinoline 1-oxidoreductase alpha subunit